MMKEAKRNALVTPWVNARVTHLLSVYRKMTIKVGDGIVEESSSDDYNQVMFTQHVQTIEAFTSHVVLVKVEGPTLKNVLTSWYKPFGWKMALCHQASPYKIHTQS